MSTTTPPSHGKMNPREYPARIPSAAPQQIVVLGGNFRTMFAGMSVVAAGMIVFYMAQFRVQGKRNPGEVKTLVEVPSWQLRHASQVQGLVPPSPPATELEERIARLPPNVASTSSKLPLPGGESKAVGVIANILALVHGKGSDDNLNHPRRIAQPAPTTRRNDSGRTYTKNSDYKDGYKRVVPPTD